MGEAGIQIENNKSNRDQNYCTAIITISIQIYALKSLTTIRANQSNLLLKSYNNLGDSNISHTISTMFVGGGEAIFM